MEGLLQPDDGNKWKMKTHLLRMPATPRILTLMYHRIDAADTDPWDICVTPQHFEEQIRFLTGHFTVLTTGEVIQQVREQSIPETAVCITFDDGYADNYMYAKPILEACGCPATVFIPTRYINGNRPFWWDELEMTFLHKTKLPERLSIRIEKDRLEFVLPQTITEVEWQAHRAWRWYHDEIPTARCAAFLQIWEKLRPLPVKEIELHLSALRQWAGIDEGSLAKRLPMNDGQLSNLAANPLFGIGLHTHTHIDLASQNCGTQKADIAENKTALHERFGVAANCLAFPYGRYNSDTVKAVEALKLSGCFTTNGSSITAKSSVHQMGRLQMNNWNKEKLQEVMQSWLK